MKKLLLTLGAVAAVAAPVASVVACGAPKQKHVDLNTDIIKGLVPDLEKAIATIMATPGGDASVPPMDSKVTEDNGGFLVTLTMKGMGGADADRTIVVAMTKEAKVTSLTIPGVQTSPEQIANVQKVMEGGTIDHSGDTTEEIKLDRSKFDDGILTKASLTFLDALPAGSSNDDIRAHNTLVKTFQNSYEEAVAQEASTLIAGIKSSTKTGAEFAAVVIGTTDYENITGEMMKNLGFADDVTKSLLKVISDGAVIAIQKGNGGDLAGFITCNGHQADFNFNTSALTFAVAKPVPATPAAGTGTPTTPAKA